MIAQEAGAVITCFLSSSCALIGSREEYLVRGWSNPVGHQAPNSPRGIMKQILTTETVHQRDRAPFWREVVCSSFVELDCDPLGDELRFFGSVENTSFGEGQLSRVIASPQHVERSQACLSGSDSNVYLLSLQMAGQGLVMQAGREARLHPGDFALYDTARPYQLHFDGPFTQLVVRVPRKLAERYLPVAEHLTAYRMSGVDGYGRLTRNFLTAACEEIDKLGKTSDDRLLQVFLQLLGSAYNERMGVVLERISSTSRAAQVARIKEYVLENLTDPDLKPPVIAAAHGISTRYLNKLFESEHCSMSRWIWGKRVEQCKRLLSDPRYNHKTISEIAFFCGFNDTAHFSRSFRDRFGSSPRDYRRNSVQPRS